ncbi:MAG TPA: diaminobutyrate--2-oxoglutarate transaminase [Nocardioidaceae bacterium]|nr:diaminobutyrate--2-oxoglutarate transaminase [Nocardioidaceae bacterium]
MSDVFESLESEVRSYCRNWPTVFDRAEGSFMYSEDGREYLDFFSGAGALNYGHNHPDLQAALIEYLQRNGVVHSLDMYSVAKREFLETFRDRILQPRGLDYKVMFPGPTGTNSVESALKLARKVTQREHVVSFTNAFHGMTLGALAVTGNSMKRGGAGIPLYHATPVPYDDYFDGETEDFLWLERVLNDSGSGIEHPAAVIVETVQGEGGLNSARASWLRKLADLCKRHDILLIVDDVQAGCGRTGSFFSFEEAGITPDIVCLSKSVSGYGLPMALTLFKPEHDVWVPGEHNGTFRGQNPSFVTGKTALERFWSDDVFAKDTVDKGTQLREGLLAIADKSEDAQVRGRGLLQGIAYPDYDMAGAVAKAAFERGLLVETSGPESEVVKLMPALTIDTNDLARGIDILADSVDAVFGRRKS